MGKSFRHNLPLGFDVKFNDFLPFPLIFIFLLQLQHKPCSPHEHQEIRGPCGPERPSVQILSIVSNFLLIFY
jgi:hypothetical protein